MNTDEMMEMIEMVNNLSSIVKQLTSENKKLKKLIESRDIELANYEEHKKLLSQLCSISNLGGGEVRGGRDGRGGGADDRGDGRSALSTVGDGRDGRDGRSGADGSSADGSSGAPSGGGIEVRGPRSALGDGRDGRSGRDGFSCKIPEARDAGGGGVEVRGPRSALSTAVGDGRDGRDGRAGDRTDDRSGDSRTFVRESKETRLEASDGGRAGGRTDDRSGDSRTFVRESKETRIEASDGSHGTRLRDVLDNSPLAMVTSGDNKKALTDMEKRTKTSIHTILTGLSLNPKTDRVRNDHGSASGASGAIGRDRVRFRFGQNEEHEY